MLGQAKVQKHKATPFMVKPVVISHVDILCQIEQLAIRSDLPETQVD